MKMKYEKPRITDEKFFEAQAMACGKTPGLGAGGDYCGPVWKDSTGNQGVCYMNPESRSS